MTKTFICGYTIVRYHPISILIGAIPHRNFAIALRNRGDEDTF